MTHLTTSEHIRTLEQNLAHLQRLSEPRRADELADVRDEIFRSMLIDLLAGRSLDGTPDADHVRR